MSTTAVNCEKGPVTCSIVQQPKSTRQIVREEIKRAEDLKKLEEQYAAGEISDFEYRVGKALLTAPYIDGIDESKGRVYSTTA